MHIFFEKFLPDAFFINQKHPLNIPLSLYQQLRKANENLELIEYDEYSEGSLITYGRLRGCSFALNKAISKKENYLYIDRGFFRKDDNGNEYFRVTYNSTVFDFSKTEFDDKRLKKFNFYIENWKNGRKVFIATPSPFECLFSGINSVEWIDEVKYNVRKTYPYIKEDDFIVSSKFENEISIKDVKDDLKMTITHNSMLAIDSLICGVPVVIDKSHYIYWYCPDLIKYEFVEEQKEKLDREKLFRTLSYLQFCMEEMNDLMLDMMMEIYRTK